MTKKSIYLHLRLSWAALGIKLEQRYIHIKKLGDILNLDVAAVDSVSVYESKYTRSLLGSQSVDILYIACAYTALTTPSNML